MDNRNYFMLLGVFFLRFKQEVKLLTLRISRASMPSGASYPFVGQDSLFYIYTYIFVQYARAIIKIKYRPHNFPQVAVVNMSVILNDLAG